MGQDEVNQRSGAVTPIALIGCLVFGLFAFLFFFMNRQESDASAIQPIMASVEQGEFVARVLDQGEIQSSENVEIRCEVRARNGNLSVIEVVPEGSRVKAGDFLVRLDSTAFEKELESQKIALVNAQTSVIQAEAELKTATESLREYEQGLFVEKKKLIENDIYDAQSLIETAKQELTQARAILEHSKKLQGKGFITAQQLEGDGFAVKRAEFSLKTAENKFELANKQLWVLENITRVKETVQFKSDIEAAKVKLANQRESLSVEQDKLEEIKEQITKCEIRVPDGVQGQVVYAKESSRRGDDWVLEEGTTVRERQVLIRLPNPELMEVKALINEQSITLVRPGMPATINVDALTGKTLSGIVTKVNQYAESGGWMSSNIRKYAVLVEIIDPPLALKPGMNAAVNIQVRYEADAIKAPIQTVYAVQDRYFCLAKGDNNQWETKEIEVDGDNSQYVLIKDGIEPGQQLVMNPGAYKELMDLPEISLDKKIEIPEAVKSRVASMTANKPTQKENSGEVKKTEKSSGRPSFSTPKSGLDLITSKDKDGDGKLTKDEAGRPYSFFFDRIDADSDGLLSEQEANQAIAQMKRMQKRMQDQGGGQTL